MKRILERCAGLDVHKKELTACRLVPGPHNTTVSEVMTFGTMTKELLALVDWLKQGGCTHVAMESTGVFWKPVFNLLEGEFEVLLVNPREVKQVPGRKTDTGDAAWLAELLQCGLLKGSFIPPAPQRQLRDLTRYRTTLVQERARILNRLQKVLEDANIKLASVVSDIDGVSARMMLQTILAGETNVTFLAELAKGRLREKRAELEQALTGLMKEHHRFLIAEHLSHMDYLEEAIARVSAEIEERLRPFQLESDLLDSSPGINLRIAEIILAEIGPNPFPTFEDADHLASWAGLCPGNQQGAGKRLSGKTRKGCAALRSALVEAAHGAAKTKNTYLSAQYHSLVRRIGKKKALVAVGHSILIAVYHILTRKEPYRELGPRYLDELRRPQRIRRHVRCLEQFGFEVVLKPLPAAA